MSRLWCFRARNAGAVISGILPRTSTDRLPNGVARRQVHPNGGIHMQHINNHDADRHARLLDQAVNGLRELAVHHQARADACKFLGDRRMRDYHVLHRHGILATADELSKAANALREREGLKPPAAHTIPHQRQETAGLAESCGT